MSITKVSTGRVVDYDFQSIPLSANQTDFKTVTTNYTLKSEDIANTIALSGQSLTSTLSVIVPSNDFPKGYQITMIRLGLSPVTVTSVASAGVSIRSAANSYNLAYQYSIASLVYTGDTNVGWIVYGDLI